MIPIRDHNPSGRTPVVTRVLIIINTLVFLYMMSLSDAGLETFANSYTLVPAAIVAGHNLITLITSMFLHASIGHIAGNMLFLHIFGNNLENQLGRVKYLVFYLICGLGASFLQIAVDPASIIPNLGASGAIAGVMGGYLLLFPHNRIDVLFKLGIFYKKGTVPAYFMIGYWFLAQLFSGVGSLAIPDAGGVAYFAHIGGFITGCVLALIYKKRTDYVERINDRQLAF